MYSSTLRHLSPHVPVLLDNATCVYCGIELNTVEVTKEHVIGRRFVPKGKLNGQWNLIVSACKDCNCKKSDLEDDISAISMHPTAWGKFAIPDQILAKEAERKSRNSVSRHTGKPVVESSEELEIKIPLAPGAEVTLNLTAPPQIESDRIFELARMQLTAFFYWITYNHETKRGGFWLGSFMPVHAAIRSDWGNPLHRAFMDAVVNWDPRVLSKGASGFFKVIIRRHPITVCWSWALEWNHKYRIVGFFGEPESAEKIAKTFPPLEMATTSQSSNQYHYRSETKLEEEKDKLFVIEGSF